MTVAEINSWITRAIGLCFVLPFSTCWTALTAKPCWVADCGEFTSAHWSKFQTEQTSANSAFKHTHWFCRTECLTSSWGQCSTKRKCIQSTKWQNVENISTGFWNIFYRFSWNIISNETWGEHLLQDLCAPARSHESKLKIALGSDVRWGWILKFEIAAEYMHYCDKGSGAVAEQVVKMETFRQLGGKQFFPFADNLKLWICKSERSEDRTCAIVGKEKCKMLCWIWKKQLLFVAAIAAVGRLAQGSGRGAYNTKVAGSITVLVKCGYLCS